MSVTRTLADFVFDTGFDDLPPAVIAAAKRGFLDTLGCALAGAQEPAVTKLVRLLQRLGGEPSAGIIGTGLRTNVPQAALANGVAAHALDFDDDIGVGYGHPSAVLVPTVLALGEALRSRGRDIIAAYVLGVEVWFKIARALPRLHPLGWHPTGVFGALGAAAAAAKLLNLDRTGIVTALGLAGSQSAGLIQNLGTMTKPFHAGNAARSGILAAMLAGEGYSATAEVIEGGLGLAFALCRGQACDLDRIGVDLGMPYAMERPGLNVKRYPCYYSAHKCIDAVLDLVEAYDIDAGDIAAVDCQVPARVAKILFHTAPRTALEAKFSMQFFMAAAIAQRALGRAQFVDANVSDPKIRALMPRIDMRAHFVADGSDPPHDHADTVEVRLRDGRLLRRRVALAKGHADHPLDQDALTAKFMDCVHDVLSPDAALRLVNAVDALERADDLDPLLDGLRMRRDA